jgi:CheY-like chemotaxis protein
MSVRIVLVADESTFDQAIEGAIRDAGMEVVVVPDGRIARAFLEAYRPDAFVLYVDLDGGTGLQAGKAILERWPVTRLIGITSFADDQPLLRPSKLGSGTSWRRMFLPPRSSARSGSSIKTRARFRSTSRWSALDPAIRASVPVRRPRRSDSSRSSWKG